MESLFSIQRKTPVCLQIIFMHQCPRFYKSRLSFGELASHNIPILYYTRKKCGVIPVSERFFTFFGKLNDFVSALSVFSSKVFSHLPRNKASSESRGFMEKASPLDHFWPSVRHFPSTHAVPPILRPLKKHSQDREPSPVSQTVALFYGAFRRKGRYDLSNIEAETDYYTVVIA